MDPNNKVSPPALTAGAASDIELFTAAIAAGVPNGCVTALRCARAAGLDPPSRGLPSTGLAVVQIRPHPFLAPVFDKFAQPEAVARRFSERVAKTSVATSGASERSESQKIGTIN